MLRIRLRPSWFLAAILTLAHATAIAIMVTVELPPGVRMFAIALLIAHWVIVVRRRSLLSSADAVVAIEVTSDHRINVETRASGWCEYEVLGSTYVTPWMTLLNLRRSGVRKVRHIALLPDSLDAEDFRKLRVWLRWKKDSANFARVP